MVSDYLNVPAHVDSECSHSRFYGAQRAPSVRLKVPQCLVQDDVLDERDAISQWLGWIHILLLQS